MLRGEMLVKIGEYELALKDAESLIKLDEPP
jgi:hypothetical protein